MSSTTSKVSAARLRVLVRDATLSLMAERPLGFSHNDVADRLGSEYRAGGESERRLRRQLQALCDKKVLNPVDRGIFVPGQAYAPDDRQGLGAAIYDAFYKAGGSLSLPELMESLNGYDVSDRVVAGLMREDGRFFQGVPLQGFRQEWFLSHSERLRVPLPGKKQMLELRVNQFARNAPRGVNLVPQLDSFRRRVGAAIRDARISKGMGAVELQADAVVADRVARCFSACRAKITDPELGSYFHTVSEWWEHEVRDGNGAALEKAWRYLEWDQGITTQPFLLGVIDVACWDALGGVLCVNSALLSRGLVASALYGL